MTSPADDVLLTAEEAAEFFCVAKATVWSWIRKYKLECRAVRPGRGRAKLYRFGDLRRAERRADEHPAGRKRRSEME